MFTSGQSSEETKGDAKTSGAETHLHLSPQRMTQNLSQEMQSGNGCEGVRSINHESQTEV